MQAHDAGKIETHFRLEMMSGKMTSDFVEIDAS